MDKKFLWGSATASYQCEGAWNVDDKAPSMWDKYLHDENLENGDVASDLYHHYEEDIRMLAEGGQNSFRFSLSWPRIIKNREGEVNPAGIAFYNRVIDTCLKYNVQPFVTIYHWDLPEYWQEQGGWLSPEVPKAYQHLAEVCFENFGNRVQLWTTFNEPKWIIVNGYLIGNYPPGENNVQHTMIAAYHMMYASALAVHSFRQGNYAGKIGIVHSYAPVDGVDDTIQTRLAVRNADNYANNWVLDTAALGEFPIDLIAKLSEDYDISFIQPAVLKVIKENTVDFLGLNYYSRTLVKPYTSGETQLRFNHTGKPGESKIMIKDWFEQVRNPDSQYTAWDTEIYPQGLQKGLLQAYDRYHLPIYVTENGIGVREDISVPQVKDDYRISYMNDHINAIMNAIDQGCPVLGYYAWSTMDLYSWKNGVEKRYGLVAVDFDHGQQRRPKDSYYWYQSIIASHGDKIQRQAY